MLFKIKVNTFLKKDFFIHSNAKDFHYRLGISKKNIFVFLLKSQIFKLSSYYRKIFC